MAAQPLPPPTPVAPPPLQRRIGLDELGLEAGLAFGAAGREVAFGLPRDIPGLAARASLAFDLVAPFGGRQAVEVWANGRVLASRAFAEGATQLVIDLPIPAEDLARDGASLRLGLRLVDQPAPSGALATLRADSHLALLLPEEMAPSVATLFRLLPHQTQVLTRPGPLPPQEAAAALRIGLALAGSGREVRILSGQPPSIERDAAGQRLWSTGAVVVGLGQVGASVIDLDGMPALALGSAQPERAAGLLDGPWRDVASAQTLAVRDARPMPAVAAGLPFSALRGALLPQEGAAPGWALEFALRDLPAGMRPEALDLALMLPPDSGSRGVATVVLNEVMLGSVALPGGEGPARLSLPIPADRIALENRLVVTLQRAGNGLSQLLPDSQLRLAPAGAPGEFLGLPAHFAEGVEVILDAPEGGGPVADSLNPVLWLLRGLVPAAAPLTVTLREGATPPRPTGPFIAVTAEPPVGSRPALRFEGGRLTVADQAGRPALDLDGVQRMIAVQLVTAEGDRPGLWVRLPTLMPALPTAAPRLERGDVALLDRQGVAMAWASGAPAPVALPTPLISPSPVAAPAAAVAAAAPARSLVLVWRPYVLAVLWLMGFALVVYAFVRPRRGIPA